MVSKLFEVLKGLLRGFQETFFWGHKPTEFPKAQSVSATPRQGSLAAGRKQEWVKRLA